MDNVMFPDVLLCLGEVIWGYVKLVRAVEKKTRSREVKSWEVRHEIWKNEVVKFALKL